MIEYTEKIEFHPQRVEDTSELLQDYFFVKMTPFKRILSMHGQTRRFYFIKKWIQDSEKNNLEFQALRFRSDLFDPKGQTAVIVDYCEDFEIEDRANMTGS